MRINTLVQIYLDKITPYRTERWTILSAIFTVYFIRILLIQKFYLITYCLGIYLLHALIEFLTPKDDNIPDPFENFDDDVYIPQNVDDEFRPFIRRRPEFDFWLFTFKLVCATFVMTFFDLFDVPVSLFILVIYFVIMSVMTARNLYKHMKKYKYNPFFINKNTY